MHCYCQGGQVKTKSPLKIILVTITILVILSGAGLFIASKKLKPEELKKIMISQLETAIPNSKVQTKALDFSIGFNSSVDIKGVDITYKGRKSYPLVSIDNLKLRIPFWSLLFGGGKIDVVLDAPRVNYIEFRKGSNWERALAKKSSKPKKAAVAPRKKKKSTTKKESDDALIPAFFAGSEINISILNLNLEYVLRDKTNGKVEVEKFLLKDVGVKSITAFELKSKIDVLKNTPNHTKLDLLIIGEANLYDWIEKKSITFNSKINLKDIKNPVLKKDIKKISINSKTTYAKSGEYSVDYRLLLEESEISKGLLKGSKKGTNLENLTVSLGLKEAAELVMDPSTLPISLTGKEKLKVTGRVNIGKKVVPLVKFDISPALNVKHGKIEVSSKIGGETTKKGIVLTAENDVFSGHVNVDTHIKTNWNPKTFKKLRPIIVNVDVRDLKINPELLATDEVPAKEEAPSAGSGKSKKNGQKPKPMTAISPVPVRVKVNFENVDLAGAKLAGGVNLKIDKTRGNLSSKGLMLDKGSLSIRNQMRISRGMLRHDFDSNLKGINLSSLQGFVPKAVLEGLSGDATGQVRGHLIGERYFANVNFGLRDGKLSKINLDSYVSGLIQKLGKLGKKIPKDKLKINGEFVKLSLKGTFDNKRHSFEKFLFVSKGNKANFYGNGNVYPLGNKGSQLKMTLDIKDPKLAKSMKKEVGTTKLPLLVKGQGYALSPDYGYTLKKVSKSAGKAQVKKEAKKQIDKLIKSDKAKKLLKGLFK